MDTRVDINDVNRLRKVFKRNNWNNYANEESVFESFCDLLNNLDPEQKKLVHELTDLYRWMPSSEYGENLNELFIDIKKDHFLNDCKKIFLVPIVKVNDRLKIKSADHCIYLAISLFKLNRHFRDISVEILDDFNKIKANLFATNGEEIIFFIDDFIGTGDTFIEGWEDITKQNKTVTIDNSCVITVAIQQVGLDVIRNKFNLKVFNSELVTKGISEHFSGPILTEKIQIMESIESKFYLPSKYSFGYKKSEALVTMSRTPNNTFPIFWKKGKIKGENYYPPFLR